jgi:replicative DNA helicase
VSRPEPMNRRLPPHNRDAERGVIGVLLLRGDLLPDVLDAGLAAGDFYAPALGNVCGAILRIAARGEGVDAVTVDAELADIEPRPTGADLVDMAAAVPSTAHAVTYARRVHDTARLRRMIAACADVTEGAYGPAARQDVDAFADWTEAEIMAATRREREREQPVLIGEAAGLAAEELRARQAGELRGVPTGLRDLDRLTGGLRAGQLAVLGARPAVGKSALAFGVALHVAEHIGPVYAASAEMSRGELGSRALAGGGVRSDRLLTGRLDDLDWRRVEQRQEQLAGVPLLVDDAPGLTLGAIRAKARRQASRRGLALVVVDYLQRFCTMDAKSVAS